MPIVTVRTNLPADKIPGSIHADLAEIVSRRLQKPKEVIWVDVTSGINITQGGSPAPLVVMSIECIGRFKPGLNLALGKEIEDWINEKLGVARDRFVIRFLPQRAQYVVLNGKHEDVRVETDEDLQ